MSQIRRIALKKILTRNGSVINVRLKGHSLIVAIAFGVLGFLEKAFLVLSMFYVLTKFVVLFIPIAEFLYQKDFQVAQLNFMEWLTILLFLYILTLGLFHISGKEFDSWQFNKISLFLYERFFLNMILSRNFNPYFVMSDPLTGRSTATLIFNNRGKGNANLFITTDNNTLGLLLLVINGNEQFIGSFLNSHFEDEVRSLMSNSRKSVYREKLVLKSSLKEHIETLNQKYGIDFTKTAPGSTE